MLGGLARPALSLSACAVAITLASQASAYYEESHVTGDEARLTVEPNGSARVEHVVSWHLVAGQYHFLDIPVGRGPLALEPSASATLEDGKVFPATLVAHEPDALRLVFDEPKGLRHGHYKVRFAYGEDLVAAHAFARDGVMWRLTFVGPSFNDGYDNGSVTFVLPAAVDAPRIADPDSALGMLSSVRRLGDKEGDKDEIELTLPRVPRHAAPTWAIRVAPRAFPGIVDASLRPPPPRAPVAVRTGPQTILFALGAFFFAVAYGAIARKKSSRFEALCREHGTTAQGLLPLSHGLRTALAGGALGAGVFLEALDFVTAGGAAIAAAMLLSGLRAAPKRDEPRGPGRWLALRPSEAFPRRGGDVFDPLTWAGSAVALGVLGSIGGLAFLLHHHGVSSQAPWLLLLDSFALLPLVVTGRRSQLPLVARFGSPPLHRLLGRLAKDKTLRVAPWARVPTGCTEPDELRLLVVPRAAMPGLVGVEVGMASWRTPTGYGFTPEVLVRVHESSAAAARMTTLATFVRPVPGRLPEERVYRLVPRLPTEDGTLRLVRRLGRELADRRLLTDAWEGEERRQPPAARKTLADAA